MATLFISDLHLEDRRPAAAEWLSVLLTGPARDSEALYILGDLFEFWIGDDALSRVAADVATRLALLSAGGVRTYFIHGNRDFLLGPDYAAKADLTLLPDSCVVDLYGRKTLLLHGDTLCTDDVAYQAFRQQSRNPAWQAAMLAKPVEERLQLAREARDLSMHHTGTAAAEIMDANADAVCAAFRRHDVRHMIHGHTHRPAVHRHDLGAGVTAERIVLADWYDHGSYLEVSAQGARSVIL